MTVPASLAMQVKRLLRVPQNPTTPRYGAEPHRNPTYETAHSGKPVSHVKGMENSLSAASVRASWTVGAFSR